MHPIVEFNIIITYCLIAQYILVTLTVAHFPLQVLFFMHEKIRQAVKANLSSSSFVNYTLT